MKEPFYKVGYKVFLDPACEPCVGMQAWPYIKDHLYAQVVGVKSSDYGVEYALEWPEEFIGGHTCAGQAAPKRGHYIPEQFLELDFEASCVVKTIPRLDVSDYPPGLALALAPIQNGGGHDNEFDTKDTKENNL